MNILQCMDDDPALFGRWFKGPSWDGWRAFLAALYGLPLSDDALELYRKFTGRQNAPTQAAREAWAIVGRRGGKSRIAALITVYQSCFVDHQPFLAPGELGTGMVVAADRAQSQVVFRYVNGFIDSVPMLSRMVVGRTKETIDLNNRIQISIATSSVAGVRGRTVVCGICDETAFWPTDDAAEPDTEVLNGLRPSMATIPNSLLLAITSAYAERGEAYTNWRDHFGRDGDPVLVWQADTRAMNPDVPEEFIAAAYARDEVAASAEYGARFRSDIVGFISRAMLDAVTVPGRLELPFVPGIEYRGFVDPSGAVSDSFVLGIAHIDKGKLVLDVLRETKPPFSPEEVTREYAVLCKSYRIVSVIGDRYGGEYSREQFRKHGVNYELSELSKSEIYMELLPAITSRQVELLDNSRMKSQLAGLERRTARGGRDSVDHRPGNHDDSANAAAGALVMAMRSAGMGGLLQMWLEDAAAFKNGQLSGADERTAEANFKKQGKASMSEAKDSDVKVRNMFFGANRGSVEPPRNTVQARTVATSAVCPQCSNPNLGRVMVPGLSGDVEERCGRCGWERIIQRAQRA